MYIPSTANAYGPKYYQTLLAQSEDEIVKPKRTPATSKNIAGARRSWTKFSQQILQEVDPIKSLHNICLRVLQVYWRWFLQNRKSRKTKSILNYMKSWSMMYRDDVGRSLEKEMIWKINTFCRTTLTKEFDLDLTLSLKESTNENDLHHILMYLWTQDKHVYPVERQRIQQNFITLLIALTTVRPGALVESDGYRGSNEALLYRNVVLRLVRDSENLDQTVLLMEVTVKLWKGERETMKPVTFVFYEHDCLIFCSVLHMLSLAFADNAFDSDDIHSVQDIYNHKIPDFKESTMIRWKEEWMHRPIFRRACSTTDGIVTSSVKALPYTSYAAQISALGSGAGFRPGLSAYAFRRGAAQVVDKIATPAERNQIMGHSNSSIFEKYYQNRVVSTDISAAFLKMPSRSSLLASVGHIGIDRDPRAPSCLNTEEKNAALADQRYICLAERVEKLHATVHKEDRWRESKTTTNQTQKRDLVLLRRSRNGLRSRLFKKALEEKRKRFFDHVDNDDICQHKRGVAVTYNPSLPVHALTARANLASIFSRIDLDDVTTSRHDRRKEALKILIDLCHLREPHYMNPASTASKDATVQIEETTPVPTEVQTKHDIRDLQTSFETMELVPLVLPSTICLFCLGDTDLTFEARTASFSRVDSLRRHVDDIHLSYYDFEKPLLYPHPSCDISLQSVNHFKNHAATVHNVFLSK